MATEGWEVDVVRRRLIRLAERMIAQKDRLTEADRAIGDGDHGIGMARGFEAAKRQLEAGQGTTPGDLLAGVGMALLTNTGGASGAIFGTFFRAGGKSVADRPRWDAEGVRVFLRGGLNAVVARGKARPGDKTMVDALAPAVAVVEAADREVSVEPLLQIAAKAAAEGAERTRQMIPQLGKAAPMGGRAKGFCDPGALSTALILQFLAEGEQ